MNRAKRARMILGAVLAFFILAVSGCAGLSFTGEELSRALNGVPATFTSYDQRGQIIDQVKGQSFRVERDERFDSSNSDGTGNNDSQVLMISLGDNVISHVGSSACLVQEGIVEVSAPGTVDFENLEKGTPFLNTLRERFQNLWQGKSKTMMIRSQDGLPLAVYAGNAVEMFATDVPKSTAFRVDGNLVWCYRVDYTIYDTELLDTP